jgi:ribosome maturation protein Sdo1
MNEAKEYLLGLAKSCIVPSCSDTRRQLHNHEVKALVEAIEESEIPIDLVRNALHLSNIVLKLLISGN